MTATIEKEKWSLRRHTKDFDKLCLVAKFIKEYTESSISNDDKANIQLLLKEKGLYSERNPEMPLDAIDHKIRDLAFYMFGYRAKVNGEKKFLFSPLGNLFLKHIENKDNLTKIFFAMLWGVQFEHPESNTSSAFNIYPFRLIFSLLADDSLENKLYAYEVEGVLMLTQHITTAEEYKGLVQKILCFRNKSDEELITFFNNERHAMVNAAHEWDYYCSEVLVSSGVIDKKNGKIICKLKHGNTNTNRRITKNVITINNELITFYETLAREYPLFETPLQLNDNERLKDDIIKEIYSFFPKCLLSEIEDNSEKAIIIEELLELPSLIEQYSNNNDGAEAYLFEDKLTEGFNMFYNIEAKKIGGAGNTDIECLYLSEPTDKKFAVDAKSTKNKLSGINSGRLREHREKIGGDYTIVITSRYVPAVKADIKNTDIVIILASTFSEYLYNCIQNDIREIDYKYFDEIVRNNYGKDISKDISDLTFKQFASSSS